MNHSIKFPLFFLGITCQIATLVVCADEMPHAAYPRPFSRPPSMGEKYNTWKDAKGPDVGVTAVNPARLPSRVDNSSRPEFPPIYKQRYGSCGQFTAIASIFTYEMNVHNGTHADSAERQFPATFSWNMINKAKNQGSEAYHGWEVAKILGVPTIKSYGSVEEKKLGRWPNGYSIWREAMEYRVAGYRYTPVATVAQVHEARGWLFDRNQPQDNKPAVGGLLALDGRMGEKSKVTHTVAEGEYGAGEEVWVRWYSDGFGHGITCAGYDDQIGYDVNGDGKITNDMDTNGDGKVNLADWERGAFIVVNSWGQKWSKDGKIYLLYSAMVDPTWERGNYLGRIEVARHIPRRTLKLKLACDQRSDLRASIGIARDKNATKPEFEIHPQVLNNWPIFGKGNQVGAVPMAGPDDTTPLELGIDLTELYQMADIAPTSSSRIFLRFSCKEKSKALGQIHACAIRSYDEKGNFLRESEIPIENGSFSSEWRKIEAAIE